MIFEHSSEELQSSVRTPEAQSQRYSVQIFGDIAASSVFNSFGLTTLQDATAEGIAAVARVQATLQHPDTEELELPRIKAENAAGQRLTEVVKELARPPDEASGVDEATRTAMTSTAAEQTELVRRENDAVDRVDRYARRGEGAILGLSLAASAASLLGLAGIVGIRRAGRILLGVAVLAWLGSIAAGAVALAT